MIFLNHKGLSDESAISIIKKNIWFSAIFFVDIDKILSANI